MCVGMEVQFLRIKQGEIMIEYTILKITRQMEAEGNIHRSLFSAVLELSLPDAHL